MWHHGNGFELFIAVAPTVFVGFEPVSYTHLDVYKRQDLFRAENASRTESRRARLIRNAGFPCVKGFDGYDWGMASFPADGGREQLMDLSLIHI